MKGGTSMFYEGCTLAEIKAYRELENETFDFGNGPMKMEHTLGSEDAYYEMDIQEHEDAIETARLEYLDDLENRDYNVEKPKRINRRNKRKDKIKNKKLQSAGWWIVSDNETHLSRIYRGKRSSYIKKKNNKKLRRAKNVGKRGHFKKVTEFWYELW